jgi:hypothetical protein
VLLTHAGGRNAAGNILIYNQGTIMLDDTLNIGLMDIGMMVMVIALQTYIADDDKTQTTCIGECCFE